MSAASSATTPISAAQKPGARVVMFGLDSATSEVLRDCFRQFGVDCVFDDDRSGQRLLREKFEACVVALDDPMASTLLETARKSSSNSRILIYGLASSTFQALSYSKYGLNAIINVPIQRALALKVVRASHLLVLNELRRYVRVPIVVGAKVTTDQREFEATTVEVSAGGMSLRTDRSLLLNQAVKVTFTLPQASEIQVRAAACWMNAAEQRVGVRFDPTDARRTAVREWVEQYLGL